MPNQLLLAFKFPNDAGRYWFQTEDVTIVDGSRIKKPILTDRQSLAHRFHPSSAVAFRDHYATLYQKLNVRVFIEDNHGQVQFEREAQAPAESEDHRPDYFVQPDGASALGFLVRPAIRPQGRCWCIRARDVPSVADRDLETVYGNTPMETTERMLATWGTLAQPSRHPYADQLDAAEAQRKAQELANEKYKGARRRPGDLAH
jgi:hypothetical protein